MSYYKVPTERGNQMVQSNKELLIKSLRTELNVSHSKLNELLHQALRTIPSSFGDVMDEQYSDFNSECQELVHNIKEYSERIGALETHS